MTDKMPKSQKRLISRYPGVQPFSDDEVQRQLFHGRDSEKYELLQLVLAERLVVVFSRSGLGKSSLINAGIMAPLRRNGYFPMVARVTGDSASPIKALYQGVEKELRRQAEVVDFQPEAAAWNRSSLWHFFKSLEIWRGATLQPPVLILDQFEELFTLHTAEDRAAFIRELASVVRGVRPRDVQDLSGMKFSETPPQVKVVLVLREEFYPNLEELRDAMPGIYRAPFRLQPLKPDQARDAIVKPASAEGDHYQTPPFKWDESAISLALGFLSGGQGKNELRSNDVEPFQLQLICQYAEDMALEKHLVTLTADDLGGEVALQSIIGNFYEDALTKVAAAFPDQKDLRTRVETLCENGFLIRETGRRRLLEESDIASKFKVDRKVLRKMLELRLIREEPRVGDSYYELAHDTLVEPIQRDRKKREAEEEIARQRREARARYSAERKRNRKYSIIAACVMLSVVGGGGYLGYQRQQAAAIEAERLARIAETEQALALAREKAALEEVERARADQLAAQVKELEAQNELNAQRAREEKVNAARAEIIALRESTLADIAKWSADASQRADAVGDGLLAAQNEVIQTQADLEAAKLQFADDKQNGTEAEQKETRRLIRRLREQLDVAEVTLAASQQAEDPPSLRAASVAIDRVYEDLRLGIEAILNDLANDSAYPATAPEPAIYVQQAKDLTNEALAQAASLVSTGRLFSETLELAGASPAAQARFALSEILLMEEDPAQSDLDLAIAYRRLQSRFRDAMSLSDSAIVAEKVQVFASSAASFLRLKDDLFICEELDAMSTYIPPRPIGPERDYLTQRSAALAELAAETAIVVTAENLINSDRSASARSVPVVALGQNTRMRTWVTSPGTVELELWLVTPAQTLKIWGPEGKRRMRVEANALQGLHVGYRLNWTETIHESYGVGTYEWQLWDLDNRPLCRARFEVE